MSGEESSSIAEEVTSQSTEDIPSTDKPLDTDPINRTINTQALPLRNYLESSVVPLLIEGLNAVARERPKNPVEYLAVYLLKHNPQKS
ncbi:dpy-30 like protein [Planoprotostelium fungivorum]|uniref:Protein dpy-30 homolog n=1 Tax=Planoprotostelium fungivorum TaxID=1890364 RepID=A0A2P6NE85_9EUKA|nr:dpy-30 like protein [Planoprotostelium fungivorum]